MRIAHVTDCYLPRLGGIELQVYDLASRQAAQGHDVTVITATAPPGSGQPVGVPDDAGVEVIRVAGRWAEPETIAYRSAFLATPRLGRLLSPYDAVHTHVSIFSPLAKLATWAASNHGVATVATSHSMWARSEHHLANLRRVTGWADLPAVWTAVSSVAAEPVRRVIGDRAQVSVLHNGVDPEQWKVVHEPGSPDVLRVAVVSRLARRKRVLQLAEILQVVHDRLPPGKTLDVSVVGDGPERARVERYMRRHAMQGWMRLLGRCEREEIRTVFSRSDLFVAPATLESFGIAALEARCAGLPVVARSGTGVEDFVVHGREGWLVSSDAAMVQTISSLAASREVLAGVAAHNRTTPASVSWESVLDACEDAYARAAAMQGRGWLPATGPAHQVPFWR